MTRNIDKQWKEALSPVLHSNVFSNLENHLNSTTATVFPPKDKIFHAFQLTPLKEVKVVILGQDPYHGEGQANGLAFSVKKGVKIPPSLRNIFKELADDCDITSPTHGDLSHWGKQGVLLLNTTLTVESGKANSHRHIGWDKVTDCAISAVNSLETPVVFMLWGNHAIQKKSLISSDRHLVLTSVHPSPLSAHRGFFGCKHFSKANTFLGTEKLEWSIT